jgi:hypothetical protein
MALVTVQEGIARVLISHRDFDEGANLGPGRTVVLDSSQPVANPALSRT